MQLLPLVASALTLFVVKFVSITLISQLSKIIDLIETTSNVLDFMASMRQFFSFISCMLASMRSNRPTFVSMISIWEFRVPRKASFSNRKFFTALKWPTKLVFWNACACTIILSTFATFNLKSPVKNNPLQRCIENVTMDWLLGGRGTKGTGRWQISVCFKLCENQQRYVY